MVERKDVILGILGASGAFSALLLVFSGLIFTQAASFPSETDNKTINKVRRAARLSVYPFWGFLVTTLLSLSWLLRQSNLIYVICVSLFVVLIVGTGIYGTITSYRYL